MRTGLPRRRSFRFSLRAILIGLFGLLAVLSAGQGILSVLSLSKIRYSITALAQQWLAAVDAANQISAQVADHRIKQYRLVTGSPDAQKVIENEARLQKVDAQLDLERQRYDRLIKSPEALALDDRFDRLWATYEQTSQKVTALMRAGRREEAYVLFTGSAMLAQLNAVRESLAATVALNREGAQREADGAVSSERAAVMVTLACVAMTIAAALAAMLFSLLGVSRPLSR